LVLYIQRNFSKCLTCRLKTTAPEKASDPPLDNNRAGPELMAQPPEAL
jgi:hypothetical protein